MNITYTIARYESLNNETFLVAFNMKDENDNSAYIESLLDISETSGKTAQEVCQLAYEKIKDKIESIKSSFEKQNAVKVGYEFVPDQY
jgi:hypothetical protein